MDRAYEMTQISLSTNSFLLSRYAVCIRQEKNMCCIQYKACADDNSFTLDTNPAVTDMAMFDSLCTGDYVGIEGEGYYNMPFD